MNIKIWIRPNSMRTRLCFFMMIPNIRPDIASNTIQKNIRKKTLKSSGNFSYLHYRKFTFNPLDFPANSTNVWTDPEILSCNTLNLPRKFLNFDPDNILKNGETVCNPNPSNIQSFLIYALLNYYWYESKGFETLNLSHTEDFSKAMHLGLSAYGGFKYCYDNGNSWPEPRLKEIFMNVKPSETSEELMHANILKIRRILSDNGLLFDNIEEFSKESFAFNQKENQKLVKFDISGLKDFLVTD